MVDNMIYTKMTKKALRICFDSHVKQIDKSGLPYVFHPFHLAEQMDDEDSVCVALLHDVVEDTNMTFEELEKEGFNDKVISALKLLTHNPQVPYMDYVSEIKKNPLAKKVKLADLRHNSNLTRLEEINDEMLSRVEKYKTAIELLEK